MRPRMRIAAGARLAALTLAALAVLLPFVWIVAASFKYEIDITMGRLVFSPTIVHFDELLFSRGSDFLRNYANSFGVALVSTALCLSAGTLGAYALDRLDTPAWLRHALLGWSMLYYMTPQMTLVGSWYVLFRQVGLGESYTALVLTHTVMNLPMALWLMGAFLRDVPVELEEAARVDACGPVKTFTHVVLPLLRPGLLATGALLFIFSWNEFAVSLALTRNETATVPVALAKFAQDFDMKYGAMAAAATLSLLPALLLLLLATRSLVRGLTQGALK
ncbi:MAG: carbohydrate ABC transporter permease [Rubrivivax sp.]|nr:carbohydrate ABC transporter permease [Burkholderiales bacterium]MCW5632073.1 carbohydrate ABC transporter permease [Rubrivivax sp.]